MKPEQRLKERAAENRAHCMYCGTPDIACFEMRSTQGPCCALCQSDETHPLRNPRPNVKPESLSEAVFQALGAASMCWDPRPTGVFDSTAAKEIGDELLKEWADGPLLGLATTEELFREIIARLTTSLRGPGAVERALILAEMLGGLDAQSREYRTAEPYEQEPAG